VQEKVPLAHVSIAALDDTDDIENAFQVGGADNPLDVVVRSFAAACLWTKIPNAQFVDMAFPLADLHVAAALHHVSDHKYRARRDSQGH
jgi:hypothetical protein